MIEDIKNKLTLSDFVKLISAGFREIFGDSGYRIIGEISKIKQRHSRIYIEMLEYEGDQVIAKAHAVIMDMKVIRDFIDKIGYDKIDELNKLKILFFATPVFHKDYGFQLHISSISSEYSIGNIKQKEVNIRQQLEKIGILENNKRLTLSLPPYNIAIISSETSDGLNDFLGIINDSPYRYSYKLYPSAIHGNQANIQVHNTLQKIFREVSSGKECFDVLIILRGGGGSSGIMWHNDLGIAKGICYMPVPVVIAIGHKQDKHLLDDICYHSAITPSDAGYWIISKYDQLSEYLHIFIDKIDAIVRDKLLSYYKDINALQQETDNLVKSRLELYKSTIKSNYEIILSNDPMRLQVLGYGIVYDQDGNILDKKKIVGLSKGDNINIKIYGKKISVEVKDIK